MKKTSFKILALAFLLTLSDVSSANTILDNDIEICLSITYDKDKVSNSQNPRMPMKRLTLYQNNNILSFNSFDDVCYLYLINKDNGEIVYSATILPGMTSCELPETFSGEYEMQLARENVLYYGEIRL